MVENLSQFNGADLLVENLRWYEVRDYLGQFNTSTGKDFQCKSEYVYYLEWPVYRDTINGPFRVDRKHFIGTALRPRMSDGA